MALDLQYDDKFDLVLPAQFISDLDELKQALLSIVVTPLGVFLNPDVGLNFDWLTNGYDEGMAENMIEDALNKDSRVTHVDSVVCTLEKNQQTVDITFKVQTTLGPIDLSKEVNLDAVN